MKELGPCCESVQMFATLEPLLLLPNANNSEFLHARCSSQFWSLKKNCSRVSLRINSNRVCKPIKRNGPLGHSSTRLAFHQAFLLQLLLHRGQVPIDVLLGHDASKF